MSIGEILRIWGVAYIGKESRSSQITAPKLIMTGPYARMRNPLYLGNMFLYSGATIIANIWAPYFLFMVWLYFGFQYSLIVLVEEKVLANLFSEKYLHYKQSTPRFLPAIIPKHQTNFIIPDYKMAMISEKTTFISISAILLILLYKMVF